MSDLAGRLADAGRLSPESAQEQKAAELPNMTAEEKQLLRELQEEYKTRFEFPFVICSRQNKKDAMIKGIKQRLKNSAEEEVRTSIEEVKKICYLRLCDIVDPKSAAKM